MRPHTPLAFLAPFLLTFLTSVVLAHTSSGQAMTIQSPREQAQRAGPADAPDDIPVRTLSVAPDDWTWQELVVAGRMQHTAIYDPVRERMVVFGGEAPPGYRRNDVWALSLTGSPEWTQLTPSGTPPSARAGHTAIYDPVRDRMVVFGGNDGSYCNDVWALSLTGDGAWTQFTPSGTPPSGRYDHTAIYDPVRDRMVVFGGINLNDVWALSLIGDGTWTQLTPSGTPPNPRRGYTAVYLPTRDRMVVFGGDSNDVWVLLLGDSPAWVEATPTGTPPSARHDHTAIYDPVRDRMVVFGGYASSHMGDVWALSLTSSGAWTQLTPSGTHPAGRSAHTAIYNPVTDHMVVFAGTNTIGGIMTASQYLSDVYALSPGDSSAWTQMKPGAPPVRCGHTAICHPGGNYMLVFGGRGLVLSVPRNDVWMLSVTDSPEWTQVIPSGTPPSARYDHTAICDPLSNRMVVFGGQISFSSYCNDVWELSLTASPEWTQLTPSGTPPSARSGHSAIYDPWRSRVVVFGGNGGTSHSDIYNDVWALSLAGNGTWTELLPTGTPPGAREYHSAIYDPEGDRMIVFGGYYYDGVDHCLTDVWALSLTGTPAWTELLPTGTPPGERCDHTATYDPERERMVVFAGRDCSTEKDDVWVLSLTGSPEWTQLTPSGTLPYARYDHTAIYDQWRGRVVVFGGYKYGIKFMNDTWALLWAPPVSVPGDHASLPPGFEFAPPRPTPSRGAVTFDFTIPRRVTVSIVVYDTAGRTVAKVADGIYEPGPHSVGWDGMDQAGIPVASGVYFVHFRAPGMRATNKVVLIR